MRRKYISLCIKLIPRRPIENAKPLEIKPKGHSPQGGTTYGNMPECEGQPTEKTSQARQAHMSQDGRYPPWGCFHPVGKMLYLQWNQCKIEG